MATLAATEEALFLRKKVRDVDFGPQCLTIHRDNQGARNLIKKVLTLSRKKLVYNAHHFIRK